MKEIEFRAETKIDNKSEARKKNQQNRKQKVNFIKNFISLFSVPSNEIKEEEKYAYHL